MTILRVPASNEIAQCPVRPQTCALRNDLLLSVSKTHYGLMMASDPKISDILPGGQSLRKLISVYCIRTSGLLSPVNNRITR